MASGVSAWPFGLVFIFGLFYIFESRLKDERCISVKCRIKRAVSITLSLGQEKEFAGGR
jgi:hypothetical protein